jgi:hypothetical protein
VLYDSGIWEWHVVSFLDLVWVLLFSIGRLGCFVACFWTEMGVFLDNIDDIDDVDKWTGWTLGFGDRRAQRNA